MVVVHRSRGVRFVIYTLDHSPPHVHVTGDGQAKINLLGPDGMRAGLVGRPRAKQRLIPAARHWTRVNNSGRRYELVYSVGIGRSDMRRLMIEAADRQDWFLQEWERIHGHLD